MSEPYLTARQAAEALGITPATLYAYTSRGRLQSEPVPGHPRERRYFREDIDRLLQRKEGRRDPATAAAHGLHWGSPVLDSNLTLIHQGKLYYRGYDAIQLAEAATLEEVAELLWDGAGEHLFDKAGSPRVTGVRALTQDPITLLQVVLPLAGSQDLAACDLRSAAVRQAGARILSLLTHAITGTRAQFPAHIALQMAWTPRNVAAAHAIRKALVLCADHELNVSAFAARCAASALASPYDAISAALATLKGRRHGAATERVTALFHEAGTAKRARAVIAGRLRRGEALPGFGHPLYPAGDPRARLLLTLSGESGNTAEWRLARSLAKAGSELLHDLPNLDFGLVALSRTWRLPPSAPLILFALGRTVGWIAHALEQYSGGAMIRPRARYTGPPPTPSSKPYPPAPASRSSSESPTARAARS